MIVPKIWMLVKEMEETTDTANSVLASIRGTLLLSFADPKRNYYILKEVSEQESVLSLMIRVLEHFIVNVSDPCMFAEWALTEGYRYDVKDKQWYNTGNAICDIERILEIYKGIKK